MRRCTRQTKRSASAPPLGLVNYFQRYNSVIYLLFPPYNTAGSLLFYVLLPSSHHLSKRGAVPSLKSPRRACCLQRLPSCPPRILVRDDLWAVQRICDGLLSRQKWITSPAGLGRRQFADTIARCHPQANQRLRRLCTQTPTSKGTPCDGRHVWSAVLYNGYSFEDFGSSIVRSAVLLEAGKA